MRQTAAGLQITHDAVTELCKTHVSVPVVTTRAISVLSQL